MGSQFTMGGKARNRQHDQGETVDPAEISNELLQSLPLGFALSSASAEDRKRCAIAVAKIAACGRAPTVQSQATREVHVFVSAIRGHELLQVAQSVETTGHRAEEAFQFIREHGETAEAALKSGERAHKTAQDELARAQAAAEDAKEKLQAARAIWAKLAESRAAICPSDPVLVEGWKVWKQAAGLADD